MNLVDLADIVEPAPVSMAPQTVGWLILALVLVAAATWTAVAVLRHRAATRYRRQALAELAALETPTISAINAVLKRTALVAYPRDVVSHLSGDSWVSFLRASGGPAPDETQAGLLADGGYSDENADGTPLINYAAQWVRHHRTGAA